MPDRASHEILLSSPDRVDSLNFLFNLRAGIITVLSRLETKKKDRNKPEMLASKWQALAYFSNTTRSLLRTERWGAITRRTRRRRIGPTGERLAKWASHVKPGRISLILCTLYDAGVWDCPGITVCCLDKFLLSSSHHAYQRR